MKVPTLSTNRVSLETFQCQVRALTDQGRKLSHLLNDREVKELRKLTEALFLEFDRELRARNWRIVEANRKAQRALKAKKKRETALLCQTGPSSEPVSHVSRNSA